MIIDITRPLCPTTAVWPGDLATEIREVARIGPTSLVNVNQLHISLHATTHIDAPSHYDAAGMTIDQLSPDLFLGPCTVLRLLPPCPDPITPQHLEAALGILTLHPRLLLATGGWADSRNFPLEYPILSPDAPAYLAARGVKLLGLDLPSVDRFPGKVIPLHLELNRHNILILESLDLSRAPAGHYELLALPLHIRGAEASPTRAVLRPLSPAR